MFCVSSSTSLIEASCCLRIKRFQILYTMPEINNRGTNKLQANNRAPLSQYSSYTVIMSYIYILKSVHLKIWKKALYGLRSQIIGWDDGIPDPGISSCYTSHIAIMLMTLFEVMIKHASLMTCMLVASSPLQ